MNLNNMFNQFNPDLMWFLPITIVSLLLKISWLFFSKSIKWLPTRIRQLFKIFKLEVMKILFKQTKPSSASWIPFFTATFMLMFSMKILGLLPYAFTTTSHISTTYSLGIPLWMSVKMLGFYIAFKSRLSHLVPQGTPSYLIPFMMIMETLSLFVQPIALGLRLAAKLTAGHLLIYLISTAIWILLNKIVLTSVMILLFTFLFILEMAVACMQAYVFTSLVHFYLVQNL